MSVNEDSRIVIDDSKVTMTLEVSFTIVICLWHRPKESVTKQNSKSPSYSVLLSAIRLSIFLSNVVAPRGGNKPHIFRLKGSDCTSMQVSSHYL